MADDRSDDDLKRRRHPRIEARIPVRVSTIEPERDRWTGRPFFRATNETCANVSRGGAFIQTAEPMEPGRRLLLELELPGGSPVEAIGRVAWNKRVLTPGGLEGEAGIGIEFMGAVPEQFEEFEAFLDEQVKP